MDDSMPSALAHPALTADESAHGSVTPPLPGLPQSAGLEAVLAAWNDATVRLQQTHESLRAEVRRLNDELAGKNQALARQSRLADLGRVTAPVAHEVRNSLIPLNLYLSLLRRRLEPDAENLALLDKLDAARTALDAKVNDLLHFTAEREPNLAPVSLRRLVNDVLVSLAPQLAAQGIQTEVSIGETDCVLADDEMLHRAVMNLVINAMDAMPDGGDLVVTGICGRETVELEVADSGCGLPRDNLPRIFEPFFTTKSNGTGLGLTIVDHIVRRHGGSVTAMNCHERGAAFTLRLPRLDGASPFPRACPESDRTASPESDRTACPESDRTASPESDRTACPKINRRAA